jgi:uncharacterized protein
MPNDIEQFLAAPVFGVVGASSDPNKYGNKVLRCYVQNGRQAIPVHPREESIEGIPCVPSVAELPPEAAISIITPPTVTEQVVATAIARGIRHVWMQPGAQSAAAVAKCQEHGINVIADGSCVLVVMGYKDH